MANGHRRGGGPGRSEETRIAPEDEDATRDLPTFTPEETRVAPPDRSSDGAGGFVPDADDEGHGQEDIITEAKGPARARPLGAGGGAPVKSEVASSWDEDEATSIMGLPGGAVGGARRPGGAAEVDAPPPFATEVRGGGAHAKGGRGDMDAPLPFATEVRGSGAHAKGARGDVDAPPPFATEVRGGGAHAKGGRGEVDAPLPFATEVRGGGAPATEVRGGPPPVLRGPPGNPPSGGRTGAEKPANWLSRGGEKPPSSGNTAGVVRLSPLEPANGKVAAAEESGPALRTMFANHSALLAEQLRDALSKKVYGRGPHRVLRIDEPEGPSTAGGKLARQAISLVPRKGSGPSLMCGWVDVAKREAQLRAYEGVARRYEAHHGEPLELQPEEYERFLGDVEDTLIKAVIKVRLLLPEETSDASTALPAARAKSRGGLAWPLALLLMGVAFALGLFVGRMPG
ncbi:hypothetical protein MYSTI_06761 [Myxococcus stipitatus DSM 14675]|uniref:Uncharacterized protein n=1 Tax=Myxococcus stipitatus (strain DSM 14675 / JCM 12634 / Mx s8) TaxID=1278073 RepID=L7UNI7_MYXSD|nr:hypothetical protein [Myxococcus stipitatus]AGC48034.1 hypothetical protein MYSTI_06761 [Myxococcus stipitatus DSM 14675]